MFPTEFINFFDGQKVRIMSSAPVRLHSLSGIYTDLTGKEVIVEGNYSGNRFYYYMRVRYGRRRFYISSKVILREEEVKMQNEEADAKSAINFWEIK